MNIYQQAKQFKVALLARERQVGAAMIQAYGGAWSRLKANLDTLTTQIADDFAAGRETTPAQLYRMERYKALLRQVELEISAFSRFAVDHIHREQSEFVRLAQIHAQQLAATSVQTPSLAWNQLPASATEHLVGMLQDGSPLASLFDGMPLEAQEAVKSALVTGLVAGQSPRDIARLLRQTLGGQLTRSLTIARTEVLRSYRVASIKSYAANDDVVDMWEWVASKSSRTCAVCLAMDGQTFPLSELFGSHPNCRCTPVPVTKSYAEIGIVGVPDTPRPAQETGAEWFAKQDAATQDEVLGVAAASLYRAGSVKLSDFVGFRDDPKWGPVRWQKSLKAVLSDTPAHS